MLVFKWNLPLSLISDENLMCVVIGVCNSSLSSRTNISCLMGEVQGLEGAGVATLLQGRGAEEHPASTPARTPAFSTRASSPRPPAPSTQLDTTLPPRGRVGTPTTPPLPTRRSTSSPTTLSRRPVGPARDRGGEASHSSSKVGPGPRPPAPTARPPPTPTCQPAVRSTPSPVPAASRTPRPAANCQSRKERPCPGVRSFCP